MSERHCPACVDGDGWDTLDECPGLPPCAACAAKNKEIARLTAENASLTELIGINRDQLAKIARLTTLVAVGREIDRALLHEDKVALQNAVEKWRALEGK